jgi:hypothetical protein
VLCWLLKQICIGVSDVISFGGAHGGGGGEGMIVFFGEDHGGGGADGMYIYVAGNTAVKAGMAYFPLAMSTAAEARTVCIFGREHGGVGENGMNFFGKVGGFCFWQRYGGG